MSQSKLAVCFLLALPVAACSKPADKVSDATCSGRPEQIAYIVARDSDDITAIDLSCMQVTRSAKIGTQLAHMGELDASGSKLYVDSEATNETVVVNTRDFSVAARLVTPTHPTHIAATRDNTNRFVAVAEGADSVFVIDGNSDTIVKTIPGFYLPHFARMSLDGRYAYVANLASNHLTRVDLTTLSMVDHVALDGFAAPPAAERLPGEDGFADAQIDQVTGLLYAAHRGTGRVLVVDTATNRKQGELRVGQRPWIVYAEHPFGSLARRHMVPNFYDRTASVINATDPAVLGALPVADQETYGVNYSPRAPGQAFLMNRQKQQIAVVDLAAMQPVDEIDVGGTTETASTSADGKYIVATVSSANRVVVIDAATRRIVKSFDGVGMYPWSVTMLRGQNYCH
jgi:DNA-binding beta-propeller fold protein YncE